MEHVRAAGSQLVQRRLPGGVRSQPLPTAFVDADGCTARFADGSTAEVASVIWATGFRIDHSFIDPDPTEDGDRDPRLHFIGLPWQRSRGSALLGFVGTDAADLARQIAEVNQQSFLARVLTD